MKNAVYFVLVFLGGFLIWFISSNIEIKNQSNEPCKLISIKEVPTSLNDYQRVMITCENGYYFVNHIISYSKNETVMIRTQSEEMFGVVIGTSKKICFNERCYKIRGI